MPDAVGQFLDPTLGSILPRPSGLEPGAFPLQTDAERLIAWTLAATGRAIVRPFGASVGEPMHYEYQDLTSWMAGVHCLGDPASADDRSQVQPAQDNPPQIGRVAPRWWWDWRRAVFSGQYWNRSLVTRTANAYLGQQNRAGTTRPLLAVSSLSTNGGVSLSSLTNMVLATPGNLTRSDLDCPLVADDGSTADPLPLRVPCWVGRQGFRGAAGQVLAAGSSTQHLGSHLQVRPVGTSFTNNLANRRLEIAAGGEYGGEGWCQAGYSMARLDGPYTFLAPDYNLPAPYPCKDGGSRLVRTLEQGAFIQLFLSPLGDSWQAIVSVQRARQIRTLSGRCFITYSNFVPIYYAEISGLTQEHLPALVEARTVVFGTTTTISLDLFPEARLVVEITVGATGLVSGHLRIDPLVAVGNSGAGWHDLMERL